MKKIIFIGILSLFLAISVGFHRNNHKIVNSQSYDNISVNCTTKNGGYYAQAPFYDKGNSDHTVTAATKKIESGKSQTLLVCENNTGLSDIQVKKGGYGRGYNYLQISQSEDTITKEITSYSNGLKPPVNHIGYIKYFFSLIHTDSKTFKLYFSEANFKNAVVVGSISY